MRPTDGSNGNDDTHRIDREIHDILVTPADYILVLYHRPTVRPAGVVMCCDVMVVNEQEEEQHADEAR